MANINVYNYLVRLLRGENLSMSDAFDFFNALTEKNADSIQIAGAITALSAKGETPEELAGMTKAIRRKSVKIDTLHKNFINTAGTGSNASKIFNVSTGAAFIAAGAGLPIAKQSNRRAVNKKGNSNILGSLDIKVSETQMSAESCLNGAGICFMYAPQFHPELQRVGEIRNKLGIRSCLKLLGVLSNPAGAPRQLIGVSHPSLLEPMAKALAILGTRRAWVVFGSDGMDELTLAGETFVAEVIGNKIRKFKISPEDFGLKKGRIDNLKADTPEESAEIIRDVLSGKRKDEAKSLLVLNAAAALLIGGYSEKPMQAARLAEQSIYSNMAQIKLERLVQTTTKGRSMTAHV